MTVVYVTHDQCEALTMSDRVAVFNDGLIQQIATPDVLYEQPRDASSPTSSARTTIFMARSNRVADGRCTVQLRDGTRIAASTSSPSAPATPRRCRSGPSACSSAPPRRRRPTACAEPSCDTIYLGDHRRVGLHAAGNPGIMIKLPGKPDQVRPRPGEQIELAFRAEDCRALDPLWHPSATRHDLSPNRSPGMRKPLVALATSPGALIGLQVGVAAAP